MAKTSIFSQKYDKKRRRKKVFKQLALVILLLIVLFLIFRNPILDKVNKVRQDITEENIATESPKNEEESYPPETQVETPIIEEKITKIYKLTPEKEISLDLENEGENLVFKAPELKVNYELDRSPSKSQMVILDTQTQELYLIKVDGQVTNITYRIYKNNKGYTESKESILKRRDNFVWAEQPRFLDEDTVVYMSQLPWFDERRFLYIVELDPLSHKNFQSVFGTDLILKNLDALGLAYEKAGETFYFTPEYEIIKP